MITSANMPEYSTTFHANTEVRLTLVAATMIRSGRPRSSISTARPPASMAMDSRLANGARAL
jgi:hypothetical protein